MYGLFQVQTPLSAYARAMQSPCPVLRDALLVLRVYGTRRLSTSGKPCSSAWSPPPSVPPSLRPSVPPSLRPS
eukprot:1371133-Rhodomonas_salina.1